MFVHLKFVLTSNVPDWSSLAPSGALPKPTTNVVVSANGKTGSQNSIYVFASNGSISQDGGGGMPAGEYEFDFDYIKA